jgi:hypothetical protein
MVCSRYSHVDSDDTCEIILEKCKSLTTLAQYTSKCKRINNSFTKSKANNYNSLIINKLIIMQKKPYVMYEGLHKSIGKLL